MSFSIYPLTNPDQKAAAAKQVLLDLPQWFGLAESIQEYIDKSRNLPCFGAFKSPSIDQPLSSPPAADNVLGFITLKATSPYTVEIHCMAVKKTYHRLGLGKSLFERAKAHAKIEGFEYLQVKTVAKGHYPQYDQTVAFYERMGFRPLEVLPALWDAHNPCLILIQKI